MRRRYDDLYAAVGGLGCIALLILFKLGIIVFCLWLAYRLVMHFTS